MKGIRPWRFSLRTLLVVLTIAGVWLGVLQHRASRQRAVVAWLRKLPALATYDYEYDIDKRWFITEGKSAYPDWLRSAVGDDFLHNVVSVELFALARPLKDEDVARICRLPALRQLCVGAVRRPDDDTGWPWEPAINDSQLAQLEILPELTDLEIENARSITDAGLVALARQTNIRSLKLVHAEQITDAGVGVLAGMRHLEGLELVRATRVTDAGISSLAGMRQLKGLAVMHAPRVTDKGLRAIAGLPNLRLLNLAGSGITDQGIERLHSATQLQWVTLAHTRISRAGLRKLREALPICDISPHMYSWTSMPNNCRLIEWQPDE
jgi:hypothetical protein